MTVKTIADWARAVPGYAGVAIYEADSEAFAENVDSAYAAKLIELLDMSPGALRASVAIAGHTFFAFRAADCAIVLKAAGRFPVLPPLDVAEPEFVDTTPAPGLPSRDDARREAATALRELGIF